MRARDLIESYPTIDVDAPAEEAARLIGAERRPALLVLDGYAVVTVLPASQVVKLMIPAYLRDDPSLVRVYDEAAADACLKRLAGKRVGDLLPKDGPAEIPVVPPDATILQCAAQMAASRSPLIVVADHADHADRADREDRDGRVLGVITASRLLDSLLP